MPLERFQSLNPWVDLPELKALLESRQHREGGEQGWYSIRNVSEQDTEVLIYDYIGYGGISADGFIRELADIRSPKITMRVNSPGGDVFDGFAIFNAIRRHPAEVSAFVDGIAASAASFIVMAAKHRVMSPHAQMMIHEAHGLCMGNARDMEKMAEVLNKASDNIASVYAERAGGTIAEWRDRMRDEMWIGDREAVVLGLADRVDGEDPEDSIAAHTPAVQNPLPTPNEGESQDDFMERCMGSDAIQEFDDQDQRVAVCMSQWREKHGGEKPEGQVDWEKLFEEIIEQEEEAVFAAG